MIAQVVQLSRSLRLVPIIGMMPARGWGFGHSRRFHVNRARGVLRHKHDDVTSSCASHVACFRVMRDSQGRHR